MLSLKLYQSFPRSCNINFIKSNLFTRRNEVYINSLRNIRRGYGNYSNIGKFVIFGLSGSVVTYISCAIWEYESYKISVRRETPYLTQLFIRIFRRSPKSQDIYWAIAGLNFLVFVLSRFRNRYSNIIATFPASPQSRPASLLFSMFTHLDFFHISMNMYALHSFSPLINYFGAPHFMAIYMTGGLLSGLGSILYKNLRHIRVPSVGASGAILTIVGMFASMNPDLIFGIPFISDITKFTFTAKNAVLGLIAFDLCGLIFFKNSRFDHVCHLTAVMLGVFYGTVGKSYIWDTRRNWMSWYYYLRS